MGDRFEVSGGAMPDTAFAIVWILIASWPIWGAFVLAFVLAMLDRRTAKKGRT
jgi:hypothetical protein